MSEQLKAAINDLGEALKSDKVAAQAIIIASEFIKAERGDK